MDRGCASPTAIWGVTGAAAANFILATECGFDPARNDIAARANPHQSLHCSSFVLIAGKGVVGKKAGAKPGHRSHPRQQPMGVNSVTPMPKAWIMHNLHLGST